MQTYSIFLSFLFHSNLLLFMSDFANSLSLLLHSDPYWLFSPEDFHVASLHHIKSDILLKVSALLNLCARKKSDIITGILSQFSLLSSKLITSSDELLLSSSSFMSSIS